MQIVPIDKKNIKTKRAYESTSTHGVSSRLQMEKMIIIIKLKLNENNICFNKFNMQIVQIDKKTPKQKALTS